MIGQMTKDLTTVQWSCRKSKWAPFGDEENHVHQPTLWVIRLGKHLILCGMWLTMTRLELSL